MFFDPHSVHMDVTLLDQDSVAFEEEVTNLQLNKVVLQYSSRF